MYKKRKDSLIKNRSEIEQRDLSSLLRDFKRIGNGGIQQELTLYLQKKIEDGILKENDQLPSQRELAKLWNTNFFSVKLATDELAKLGFLNKQQGRGMFVAPQPGKIFRVGIYTSKRQENGSGSLSFLIIHEIVCRRLQELGIEYEIWNDFRPEKEHAEPPSAMKEAIIGGRIQAVIGIIVRSYDTWFMRIPVKKVSIMGERQIHSACEKLVQELNRRGCRRTAAIAPVNSEGWSFLIEEFRNAGLRFRKDRIRELDESEYLTGMWDEIGYRKTMELLTATTRPDALIVYPDNAAQGAIQAILTLGIKVPEELFVIFHRNVELNYFSPFPVAYLDSSLTAIAERLVQAVAGPRADGSAGNTQSLIFNANQER